MTALPPPPQHLVEAPPPWIEERALRFELAPDPEERPCRRCGRRAHALEGELSDARLALEALTALLETLQDAHRFSASAALESTAEVGELRALLEEFVRLSHEQEKEMAGVRKLLLRKRRELAATLPARRPAAAASTPAAASGKSALAAGAVEASRLVALEAELLAERKRVARYARYVEALEGRLKAMASSHATQGEEALIG